MCIYIYIHIYIYTNKSFLYVKNTFLAYYKHYVYVSWLATIYIYFKILCKHLHTLL